MSQFAMMIPPQGAVSTLKNSAGTTTEGQQTGLTGDSEGLSFAQTLQELSETNPNAAALLLALQQVGLLPELPGTLQSGGSVLPSEIASGGNVLPPPQLQQHQLNSLQSLQSPQSLPPDQQQLLEPGQLELLLGDKPMPDASRMLSSVIKSNLVADGLQTLESRGLGDITTQLQAVGLGMQNSQTAGATRPMIALPVQVPVGQPGWDGEVGERIQWMMSRNVQQAEIKLTPPNLGPMEIKISLQNDQTSVHFIASHSATREALEAAIPRLRELFGEINLNLANVDVGQKQSDGASTQGGTLGSGSDSGEYTSSEGYELGHHSHEGGVDLQSRGLLDTYA
jgi:flagellar hook-length control protein FliK